MIEKMTNGHIAMIAQARLDGVATAASLAQSAACADLEEVGLLAGVAPRRFELTALGKLVVMAMEAEFKAGVERGRHFALGDAALAVFKRSVDHTETSVAACANGKKGKERREATAALALIKAATELLEIAVKERKGKS